MLQFGNTPLLFAILLLSIPTGFARGDDQGGRYYPSAKEWESTTLGGSPQQAALKAAVDFAMSRESSGFIVLQGGRILAERYAEVQSPSFHYSRRVHGNAKAGGVREDVASAQKSVTGLLVGMASGRGLLAITDPVSVHLGKGWSKATSAQERKITIRHLITMTSGLNDRLQYVAPAGQAWKYNSTAYGKSLDVVVAAAKMDRNDLTKEWLTGPLNMTDSHWITRPGADRNEGTSNPHGFVTSTRDLARFGLLMLRNGQWCGEDVVKDRTYLRAATRPSQNLNPSYGYLWWLNGQKFIIRGTRRVRKPLLPEAPNDLFAALGAMGRKCYVVPSRELVVVRLGDEPNALGQPRFDNELWRLLAAAEL